MDDALYNVGQRLDALAADDERAYLHRTTHPLSTAVTQFQGDGSRSDTRDPSHGDLRDRHQGHHDPRTTTRHAFAFTSLLGLSAYYLRVTLAIHVGWCVLSYNLVASAIVSLRESIAATLAIAASGFRDNAMANAGFVPQSGAGAGLITYDEAWDQLLPSMQWPWTQLARTFGATAVGAAIGSALFGSLADHYGRRRVLLVATTLWVVAHIGVWLDASPQGSSSTLLSSSSPSAATLTILCRGLEGVGFGGQVVLFHLLSAELAAQRQRGRLLTLSLAGILVGALAAAYTTVPLVQALGGDPRVFHTAVLSGLGVVFLLAMGCLVRESPRYLAASGRVDAALRGMTRIEQAHGVHWQAYDHDHDHDHAVVVEPPVALLQRQQRAQVQPGIGALAPGMVSLRISLRRRWARVLCRPPYRARSLGLALFWLLTAATVVITVAATSRFACVNITIVLIASGGAGLVSFTATAAFVDRRGRVAMVTGAVVLIALGVALAALHLQLFLAHLPPIDPVPAPLSTPPASVVHEPWHRDDATRFAIAKAESSSVLVAVTCVVLAGGMASVFASGAVWTLEQYGVMIRATGVGHALALGWLGVAGALWLVWSTSVPPPVKGAAVAVPPTYAWLAVDLRGEDALILMWASAAILLLVAAVAWMRGFETRGREDCDMVISDDRSRVDKEEETGATEESTRSPRGPLSGEEAAGNPPWILPKSSSSDSGSSSPCAYNKGEQPYRHHQQGARPVRTTTDETLCSSADSSLAHSSSSVNMFPSEAEAEVQARCPLSSPLGRTGFAQMNAEQRESVLLAAQDMLTIETDPFEGMGEDEFVAVESPSSPIVAGRALPKRSRKLGPASA